MNRGYDPSIHHFFKLPNSGWRCYECTLTAPESKYPPCDYCGAFHGDDCGLTDCINILLLELDSPG